MPVLDIGGPVGSPSGTGVCTPWATADDLCEPCTAETPRIEDFLGVASDALFERTARRFPGSCLDTVRPCAADVDPKLARHDRRFFGSCRCGYANWSTCNCSVLSEILLPGEPVVQVNEVKVDGVVLDPSLYRLDPGGWLVRLPDPDGTRPRWRCCQDMAVASDQPNTFEVSYVHGTPPPAGGRLAAAELACELARFCTGDTECRLSPRVTGSLARQGVTVQLDSLTTALREGQTGLPITDLFLGTYNPHLLQRRASVWTPDMHQGVRRVGT